jgi:hypothetical protein
VHCWGLRGNLKGAGGVVRGEGVEGDEGAGAVDSRQMMVPHLGLINSY